MTIVRLHPLKFVQVYLSSRLKFGIFIGDYGRNWVLNLGRLRITVLRPTYWKKIS